MTDTTTTSAAGELVTIRGAARFTDFGLFGTSDPRHGTHATVILHNGDSLGVSRYDDEPARQWAVDSAFRANGFPLWSNGRGARISTVRTLGDAAVIGALETVRDELTRETVGA